jgi:hypothetical protein
MTEEKRQNIVDNLIPSKWDVGPYDWAILLKNMIATISGVTVTGSDGDPRPTAFQLPWRHRPKRRFGARSTSASGPARVLGNVPPEGQLWLAPRSAPKIELSLRGNLAQNISDCKAFLLKASLTLSKKVHIMRGMNKLPVATRAKILAMLCEGASMRS